MLMTADKPDMLAAHQGWYTAAQAMRRLGLNKGGFAELVRTHRIPHERNTHDQRSRLYSAAIIDNLVRIRNEARQAVSKDDFYTSTQARSLLDRSNRPAFARLVKKAGISYIIDPTDGKTRLYRKADIDDLIRYAVPTIPADSPFVQGDKS